MLRHGAGNGDFAAIFWCFGPLCRLGVDILCARYFSSGLVSGLGSPRLRFAGTTPTNSPKRAPTLPHYYEHSDKHCCNSFAQSLSIVKFWYNSCFRINSVWFDRNEPFRKIILGVSFVINISVSRKWLCLGRLCWVRVRFGPFWWLRPAWISGGICLS